MARKKGCSLGLQAAKGSDPGPDGARGGLAGAVDRRQSSVSMPASGGPLGGLGAPGLRRTSGKRGPANTGLSVTYTVVTPAARITSVMSGWWSQTGLKPGTSGIPSVRRQSRKGKPRMPVTSARRTGSAGIDSGMARSKRSESPVRSSRLGVSAGESPSNAFTWLARTSGSTTSSDVQPLARRRPAPGRRAAPRPIRPAPRRRRSRPRAAAVPGG